MPDSFDPTMMLSDAKNVGSASGGATTPGSGGKQTYAQAFDPTANTGTTTVVKDGSAPTKTPSGGASAVPAGVAKFGGGSV